MHWRYLIIVAHLSMLVFLLTSDNFFLNYVIELYCASILLLDKFLSFVSNSFSNNYCLAKEQKNNINCNF